MALNQRNALPNALYIAFTGTPLKKEDELTRRVFGDYVSRYGFQRAVEDGATVPLYYNARGEKLGVATDGLNERIAEKLDEFEADDVDVEQRLERELKRDYHIITAPDRLDAVARDFVSHYTTAWESGKAMLIAIDKITAVRMHGLIEKHWRDRVRQLEGELSTAASGEERLALERQFGLDEEDKDRSRSQRGAGRGRQVPQLGSRRSAPPPADQGGLRDRRRRADRRKRVVNPGIYGGDGGGWAVGRSAR